MRTKEQIEQRQRELAEEMEQLAKQQEQLANDLANLDKEPEPWEPNGGEWFLSSISICQGPSSTEYQKAGQEFETQEQAEDAQKWDKFYHRLRKLAQELNPSGKIGGKFEVQYSDGKYMSGWSRGMYAGGLFETVEVAQQAAKIMTRDKWEYPGA